MSACLDCGGHGGHFAYCDRDERVTVETLCECEHNRGSHDALGNCWHVDRGTGEEDCDCDQFRLPAPSAGPAEDMTVREPSAGQDTERLRDEMARWLCTERHGGDEAVWRWFSEEHPDGWRNEASRLLDGPLRQLIAERDEARAQVQRVRELAAELERPVEGLTGPGGPLPPLYNGQDVAYRIRRALDNP